MHVETNNVEPYDAASDQGLHILPLTKKSYIIIKIVKIYGKDW